MTQRLLTHCFFRFRENFLCLRESSQTVLRPVQSTGSACLFTITETLPLHYDMQGQDLPKLAHILESGHVMRQNIGS